MALRLWINITNKEGGNLSQIFLKKVSFVISCNTYNRQKKKHIYQLDDISGFFSTVKFEFLFLILFWLITLFTMLSNQEKNNFALIPIISFQAGLGLNRTYWEKKVEIIRPDEINLQIITSYWLKARLYAHVSVIILIILHIYQTYLI